MALDGTIPMGSVVVGPAQSRTLRIDVTGLPDGGAVQLVRGVVDRAGQADPRPGTTVVQTLGAGDLDRADAVPSTSPATASTASRWSTAPARSSATASRSGCSAAEPAGRVPERAAPSETRRHRDPCLHDGGRGGSSLGGRRSAAAAIHGGSRGTFAMCDGHEHVGALDRDVSRRRVLQGIVGLAALAGLGGRAGIASAALPPRPPNAAGLNAYALAMHLHASASEGAGSVRSQLAQAALNGLDVAWFADHDWRRHRLLFRQTSRSSPTRHSSAAPGTCRRWPTPGRWPPGRRGPGDDAGEPERPGVPEGLPAAARDQRRYRRGLGPQPDRREGSSRANFRSRIAGRTVVLDVLPSKSGVDAWGEVQFQLSHQPAAGIRPTGVGSRSTASAPTSPCGPGAAAG